MLDVVSYGLRALPGIRLDNYPRMADFVKWLIACEGALWEPGTFLRAYERNRVKATADVIDADLLARTVERFIDGEGGAWDGETATLLDCLNALVDDTTRRSKQWPKGLSVLSGRLRRLATAMRSIGIEITKKRNPKGRTLWNLIRKEASVASEPQSLRLIEISKIWALRLLKMKPQGGQRSLRA
jgi:hypothetical protein